MLVEDVKVQLVLVLGMEVEADVQDTLGDGERLVVLQVDVLVDELFVDEVDVEGLLMDEGTRGSCSQGCR